MNKYEILKTIQDKMIAERTAFRREAKREGFSLKEIREMPIYQEMHKNILDAERILGVSAEEMALWEENN